MFIKKAGEYEKLYSLDVLGVEDRGEDHQWNVYSSFKESITRGVDCQYQVSMPWIPGSSLSSTNEQPSRRHLIRVEKKLSQDPKLREEYKKIGERPLQRGYKVCIKYAAAFTGFGPSAISPMQLILGAFSPLLTFANG